jgi:hypothetical protein
MEKGYNLILNETEKLKEMYSIGEQHYEEDLEILNETIKMFQLPNGRIDGTKLQANWFPQIKADIFLSHSHDDLNLCKMLAGWLVYKFNLKVFIDSSIWGNANELLKMVDNEFCYNKENDTYNYEKRNKTTSHVYMMLNNAIANMIFDTEIVIFINTPKSIIVEKDVTKTLSPWIYTEIALTKLLKPIDLSEGAKIAKSLDFDTEYDIDLSHLTRISLTELEIKAIVWSIEKALNKQAPRIIKKGFI